MARHTASHRMDCILHDHALVCELLSQFLECMLSTCYRQTIAGNDDHGFSIAHQESSVISRAGLDRTLLRRAAGHRCGSVTTETAQNDVEEGAIHRLAHDVGQNRTAGADQ